MFYLRFDRAFWVCKAAKCKCQRTKDERNNHHLKSLHKQLTYDVEQAESFDIFVAVISWNKIASTTFQAPSPSVPITALLISRHIKPTTKPATTAIIIS